MDVYRSGDVLRGFEEEVLDKENIFFGDSAVEVLGVVVFAVNLCDVKIGESDVG